MKKLLALLLLVCMLAGCAPVSPPETAPSETASPVTDAPALPTETEGPTELESDLLDGMAPVQEGGKLFRIQNEAFQPECMFSSMALVDGGLLLGGYVGEISPEFVEGDIPYRLILLDIRTGRLKAETRFDTSDGVMLQACGDKIAVCDWGNGEIRLLDKNLKQLSACKIAGRWYAAYVDSGARFAYTVSDSTDLVRTELATGKQDVILGGMLNLYINTGSGNTLILGYIDPDTQRNTHAYLDMRDGKVLRLPLNLEGGITNIRCVDDVWLASSNSSSQLYLYGKADDPHVFLSSGASFGLIDGPAPLCAMDYTVNSLQKLMLYDRQGRFLASCAYPSEDGAISYPVWCPRRNGYFMITSTASGQPELLFWDPVGGEKFDDLSFQAPDAGQVRPGGTAVSQKLYDRADAMSRKYGVRILIADQCGTKFSDFSAAPTMDYWTITAGLNALDEALSSYPEGFMDQLLYSDYEVTEIHLVGSVQSDVIPEGANGFTEFAAFVVNSYGRHSMVIDITQQDLVQTVYHEFSHIIDDKLAFNSRIRPAIYSEEAWSNLNPRKFQYAYSVYQVPGSFETDGYDGYFVDTYARTYPTEDRARIMEYAMIGHAGYFVGKANRPLREKLAFYSAAIRECFDTTGWPEETLWEKSLQGYRYQIPQKNAA